MARIRAVEITNFRGISNLVWYPSAGVNCLVGPGDSGKSSILNAIDFCLGARRGLQLSDADFHCLNVETPIIITITLGDLDDDLKKLDAYGMYLRGFDPETNTFEDEPEQNLETVLTLKLTVEGDLEPAWTLVSERAEAQGLSRNLSWADRVRLAPARIGATAAHHLSWRHGSVLTRVSEERADTSAALTKAARDARAAFGEHPHDQLAETLGIVAATASELGIPVGDNVTAMLDAESVSFSGGTISLHNEHGVPLRGLGTGSTRLLVTGLQRKAAEHSTILLVDELEHGLEPHRIIRLLGSLGAKETASPLQVFMTTHSPVVLRELSGDQLLVTRASTDGHSVHPLGTADDLQSTVRLYPEAFLAPRIIVCEGASEIGLIRGLDLYRTANGSGSIAAHGTALIDCGGGPADKPFTRGLAFQQCGYTAAIVRDADQDPSTTVNDTFVSDGGTVISWRERRALEDELFSSLTDEGVSKLVERAVELHGEDLIAAHIRSASENTVSLEDVGTSAILFGIPESTRIALGKAAKTKKNGWFKSVTWMEGVARDIVGPDLANADEGFRKLVDQIFTWACDASE